MDILNWFYAKYAEIDSTRKKSFCILFIFGCILYSFQAYNFLIGYHSFYLLDSTKQGLDKLGRFTNQWFEAITLYNYLPLLNTTICVLVLAVGAVLLGKLWKIPNTKTAYTLFGAFLLATPHTITWIYFASFANYFPYLLVPAALLLLQQKKIRQAIVAVFFIFLSFGIYQVAVNTLAVIFIGMLIFDTIDFSKDKFTELKSKYIWLTSGIVGGFIIYLLVYIMYKISDKITGDGNYMTTLNGPLEMLNKIPNVFIDSFNYFFQTQIYFSASYKALIVFIAVLAIAALIWNSIKNNISPIKKITLVVFLLVITVFCTNISNIISATDVISEPRTAFYGYVCFVMFCIAVILKTEKKILNDLGILVLIALIYVSCVNNLLFQRNWKLAYDVELGTMQRVIYRIEEQANFNINNNYFLYNIGSPQSIGITLQTGKNKKLTPFSEAITSWPKGIINFLDPKMKIKSGLWDTYPQNTSPPTQKKLTEAIFEAKPWPHPSSVQVIDDVIMIVWSEKALLTEQKRIDPQKIITKAHTKKELLPENQYLELVITSFSSEIENKKALLEAENDNIYRIRPGENKATKANFSVNKPAILNIEAKLPKERGSLRCIYREGNVKVNIEHAGNIDTFELNPGEKHFTKLKLIPDDIFTILVDNNGQYSNCDEMFIEFSQTYE